MPPGSPGVPHTPGPANPRAQAGTAAGTAGTAHPHTAQGPKQALAQSPFKSTLQTLQLNGTFGGAGELLFVYFMMHFGLSQLRCYPTPVRSPFSGLITDTRCAEWEPGRLLLFLMRHVHLVPDYQCSGSGKRQKASLSSAPHGARSSGESQEDKCPCVGQPSPPSPFGTVFAALLFHF